MARAAHPALALAVVCAGTLIAPLDSAVNVAFPLITAAFDVAVRDIQWVVIAYVAAQACMTLVFGRLGDLYGHRRMFAVAMGACAAAHLAIGFAPTYGSLIVLRIVQGAAVGAAVACGSALATLLFEPALKRRVLAIYVTTVSLGGAVGPIAGGALIEWLGWPGVFWIRAPIALLVLALLPLVPDARAPLTSASAHGVSSRKSFDWKGAVYLAVTIGAVVLLMSGVDAGGTGMSLALLAAGSIALVLFLRHELHTASPLVSMEPFRSRAFRALQLVSVAINLACFSIMLLVPYVLIARAELSIPAGGVVLAMFPAGAFVGALAAARISHGVRSVALVRAGLLIAAMGLMVTAALLGSASPVILAGTLALTGLGLGTFQVGYSDMTTSMLPLSERGVAASLVNLTRLAGVMLGAAVGSWLYEMLRDFQAAIAVMATGLIAVALYAAFARAGSSKP
jgi:MFS family permease